MEKINLTQFLSRHHAVMLDTMIFIYQFEAHPLFSPLTHTIFTALEERKNQGYFSTISLLEILVKPKRLHNFPLALQYFETLTHSPFLNIIPVTPEVADTASGFRAKYNLDAPDAIVAATGFSEGATGLITADKRMKVIEELDVLVIQK